MTSIAAPSDVSGPAGPSGRRRRVEAIVAPAIASGVMVALSLPPFGFWPLAPLGFACLARALSVPSVAGRAGRRAATGAVFGLGQYAIGLWWVTEFHWAGFAALVFLGMGFTAAAGALVPGRMAGA